MAKLQTRRAISLRGSTYALLGDHCAAKGLSMSAFIEDLLQPILGTTWAPRATEDARQRTIDGQRAHRAPPVTAPPSAPVFTAAQRALMERYARPPAPPAPPAPTPAPAPLPVPELPPRARKREAEHARLPPPLPKQPRSVAIRDGSDALGARPAPARALIPVRPTGNVVAF